MSKTSQFKRLVRTTAAMLHNKKTAKKSKRWYYLSVHWHWLYGGVLLSNITFWPWTVVIRGGSRDKSLHQVWRSYAYPFLIFELRCLPYASNATIDCFVATAHSPHHMTRA